MMKTRTKFLVVDTMFNYFLFTPLVLLFWYGTYALIDALILSQFESRLVGSILTLVIGVYIEFAITYWQVRAHCVVYRALRADYWLSGTTVRALVLGRFSPKNKNRIERSCQKMNKNISYYKGVMLWQLMRFF